MTKSIPSSTSSKTDTFTAMIRGALEKKQDVSDLFTSIVSYPADRKNEILNELDLDFLLMIMKGQPSALPSFLTLLQNSAKKDNILQAALDSRLTEIVDYLGSESIALAYFFNCVTDKIPQSEFGFYGDTIKAFFNTLHHHFNAFPYLLDIVKKLPIEARRIVYTKDHLNEPGSPTGDNVLSIFIRHYKNPNSELKSSYFEHLLADIAELNVNDQIQIFTTALTQFEGENDLLMLSALYYPQAIPALLNHFDKLAESTLYDRVFNSDNTIHKVLLRLIQNNNPESTFAVKPLLAKIDQLKTDNNINVLTLDNLIAILQMALTNGFEVENVLDLVEKLEMEAKKQLLSADVSILAIAAAHYPDALPHIFNIIDKCDDITQQQIIINSCEKGSVLNFMHELSIVPFLTIVVRLDKAQRSKIFPTGINDLNKKVFAYPEAIPLFINATADIRHKYVTTSIFHEALDCSFQALMVSLPVIAQIFNPQLGSKALSYVVTGYDSLFVRILKNYPTEVENFLKTVNELFLENVIALFEGDSNGLYALQYAIKYKPECVKLLVEFLKTKNISLRISSAFLIKAFESPDNKVAESINQLDKDDLELLFAPAVVMETIRCARDETFVKVMNLVTNFSENHKIKVFTELNKRGKNAFIYAIKKEKHVCYATVGNYHSSSGYIPFYAKTLLQIIVTLPDQTIIQILQSQDRISGINCLQLAKDQYNQENLEKIFSLDLFPDRLSIQYLISRYVNKQAFKNNLSKSLQTLQSDSITFASPEIAALKKRLDKMVISGNQKKALVLDKYNELKKDESKFPNNLRHALTQKNSPISLALAKERFLFSVREATSVRELRNQALMNNNRSNKLTIAYSANFSSSGSAVLIQHSSNEQILQVKSLLFKSKTLTREEMAQLKTLLCTLNLKEFELGNLFKEMFKNNKPNSNNIKYLFKLCVKSFYQSRLYLDEYSTFDSEYLHNLAVIAPTKLIKYYQLQDIAVTELQSYINSKTGTIEQITDELIRLVNNLRTDRLLSSVINIGKVFKDLTAEIEKYRYDVKSTTIDL